MKKVHMPDCKGYTQRLEQHNIRLKMAYWVLRRALIGRRNANRELRWHSGLSRARYWLKMAHAGMKMAELWRARMINKGVSLSLL